MEQPNGEPAVIQFKDLPTEYYWLDFIVDHLNPHLDKEMKVSMQAGELIGKIYDELFTQYRDPTNASSQRSINELSVRLVFVCTLKMPVFLVVTVCFTIISMSWRGAMD